MNQLDVYRAWLAHYNRFNRIGSTFDAAGRVEALTALRTILGAAQNAAPLGMSDGSMSRHVWNTCWAFVQAASEIEERLTRIDGLAEQIRTGTYAHVTGDAPPPGTDATGVGWTEEDIPF